MPGYFRNSLTNFLRDITVTMQVSGIQRGSEAINGTVNGISGEGNIKEKEKREKSCF